MVFQSSSSSKASSSPSVISLLKSGMFDTSHRITPLFHTAAYLQLVIIVLNLTPIPGLDGWGILSSILPKTFLEVAEKASLLTIILFLVLLIFTDVFNGYLHFIASLSERIGIDVDVAVVGMDYINIGKIFGLFWS